MKTGEGFRGDDVKLLNKFGSGPHFDKWVAGSPNTPDHEEQYRRKAVRRYISRYIPPSPAKLTLGEFFVVGFSVSAVG